MGNINIRVTIVESVSRSVILSVPEVYTGTDIMAAIDKEIELPSQLLTDWEGDDLDFIIT